MVKYSVLIDGEEIGHLIERDSYQTRWEPVFGQPVVSMAGIAHVDLIRHKGGLTFAFNPLTSAQTREACRLLLGSPPLTVTYHCLQRDAVVCCRMIPDVPSAKFLSRCLARGTTWNELDEITLEEL